MPCPILDTPPETKLGIIEALQANGTAKDLLNLSCICHAFRDILIPYVFKSIVLRNHVKSGVSVQAIADGEYAHHVKELHYQGKHPIPECEYEQEVEWDLLNDNMRCHLLPSGIEQILSDLSCFPKLERLIVEFPFGNGMKYPDSGLDNDDEEDYEWMNAFYNFEEYEHPDSVEKYEERYGWRAIMADSWNAIVKNNNSVIKSLELRGTVSKEVSTWKTQSFIDLLKPLEEFKVSIRGNDNGAGWHINTLEAYIEFVTNLDGYFFDHLPNVTKLGLSASRYGPIGLEGMRHAPFELKPDLMPLVNSLNLQYIFIDPPLVEFLVRHSQQLEELIFNHCMGSIEGLAENGIYWENLFTSLFKANPRKLRRLEILPLEIPFGESETTSESENWEQVKKVLAENDDRRAFPYATLDDKYGMLFEDEDTNVEAFLDGKDQKSYNELMEIVKKNARMA